MKKLILKNSKTIRKTIYNSIRKQILQGDIPPGQHLIEAKLAREVGTSRTPVREALHSLEAEGLIESLPRIGYIVAPLSEGEVEEICAIRIAIEQLALSWAIEKAYSKLVADLEWNVSLQKESVSRGDFKSFITLDAQFHHIIARHSGSKRLLELAQTLRQHMLRYRIHSMYSSENAVAAMKGHMAILKGVKKNDREEGSKALVDHVERSREAMVRYAFREKPLRAR